MTTFITWPMTETPTSKMKWVDLGGAGNTILWGITEQGLRALYHPSEGINWKEFVNEQASATDGDSAAKNIKFERISIISPAGDCYAIDNEGNLYGCVMRHPDSVQKVKVEDESTGETLSVKSFAWHISGSVWLVDTGGNIYSCKSSELKHGKFSMTYMGGGFTDVSVSKTDGSVFAISNKDGLNYWDSSSEKWIAIPGKKGAEADWLKQAAVESTGRQWCISGSPSPRHLAVHRDHDPEKPKSGAWGEFTIPAVQVASGQDRSRSDYLAMVTDGGNVLRGGFQKAYSYHLAGADEFSKEFSVACLGASNPDAVVAGWTEESDKRATVQIVLLEDQTGTAPDKEGVIARYRVGLRFVHTHLTESSYSLARNTFGLKTAEDKPCDLIGQQLQDSPDVFLLTIFPAGDGSSTHLGSQSFDGLLVHEASGLTLLGAESSADDGQPVELKQTGPMDTIKLSFSLVK